MEGLSQEGLSHVVLRLPDDCLLFIFQKLNSSTDRESFGLTCHHWLHIQNMTRQSLQFHCSLTQHSLPSPPHTSTGINDFHLYRLLTRFQHLRSLSLSGCTDLPDSGLTQLQHYGSKLHTLYLDCCFRITDHGLTLVARGCLSLTILSLYRCNITNVGLETLAKSFTGLRSVNLSHCSLISDVGVRAVLQKCHRLQGLRISCCKGINGVGFKGCSPVLACLEADSCKLEPEGIMGIVSGGGLEYLDISNLSWGVRGDGLREIGAGGFATRLKILDCRMCRSISDDSVAVIAKRCPSLQEWNLAVCHEIRSNGWISIGVNCHNLVRLHVNRCQNFRDSELLALRDGCERLSVLYLSRCQQITPPAIELFKCFRGRVEIKDEEVMCIRPDWAFR